MSKKCLVISTLAAALLPWILFSEPLHDNVNRLLSDVTSIFLTKNPDSLVAKTQSDLIEVKGGSFYFGKFDTQYGDQHYADPSYSNTLPVNHVSIEDFAITKFQITYADYDIYTQVNDKVPIEITDAQQKELKEPLIPVKLTWQEARDYCLWLGKASGTQMDLPTEQQWEYAARIRGQFILYPTDTGIVEPGRNVPAEIDKESTSYSSLETKLMPVGIFPPNALGIYDLASNGLEWTRDKYNEPGYWENHELYKDDIVVRSQIMLARGGAPTIYRRSDNKNSRNTARCVVSR